jgi:hypothetical protein
MNPRIAEVRMGSYSYCAVLSSACTVWPPDCRGQNGLVQLLCSVELCMYCMTPWLQRSEWARTGTVLCSVAQCMYCMTPWLQRSEWARTATVHSVQCWAVHVLYDPLITEVRMGSYSYCASGRQLASWYGGSTQLDYDDNQEPTAADHGDVLYTIGRCKIKICVINLKYV